MQGFRPRTHWAWEVLRTSNIPVSYNALPKKLFSPSDLESLRAHADTEQALKLLKELEKMPAYSPHLEPKIQALFDKPPQPETGLRWLTHLPEPDWVAYSRKYQDLDVDYLREKWTEPAGTEQEKEQARSDRQEAVELLKWYQQVTNEVVELERDRLKAELADELSSAKDSEEQDLIKNYYNTLLGRVQHDTIRKLRILSAIQTAAPSISLGDVGGLPPLPNREKLKDWYQVGLIDSYFEDEQRQKLARYREVVSREMARLERFPEPHDHLMKTCDYEVWKAGSNASQAAKAREAFKLKLDAYSEWKAAKFTPESPDLRFTDAVAIKFLKSKDVEVPRTRRELYLQIEDLDKEEWEQYLTNEQVRRMLRLQEEHRKNNTGTALSASRNAEDEAVELLWDQYALREKFYRITIAHLEKTIEAAEKDLDNIGDVDYSEILYQHPDWEEEIKLRISRHQWDSSESPEQYDKDYRHIEELEKTWWGAAAEPHH